MAYAGLRPNEVRALPRRDMKLRREYGLDSAFERVRDRAGLAGWSVYALRHYAITTWLRRGIPVHVVQKMAGHRNLATTQHYVHFLKADLEDAARRLDADVRLHAQSS